jgi:hypothetical protein
MMEASEMMKAINWHSAQRAKLPARVRRIGGLFRLDGVAVLDV